MSTKRTRAGAGKQARLPAPDRTTNESVNGSTRKAANGKPGDTGKSRERRLFDALSSNDSETVSTARLRQALRESGLRLDDTRLAECVDALSAFEDEANAGEHRLGFTEFAKIVRPNILTIERSLKRELVIPDFEGFATDMRRIFEMAGNSTEGKVSDYIPQLGRVEPDLFGAAVCTIDGQRLTMGDADRPFCVQSVSKAISYCLALEEHGESYVHEHMGCEPSGQSFNELTLNTKGQPHNPMINAGGIMSSALIRRELTMADRFDYVLDKWAQLAGGIRPGFSNPTYLSERRTADRNFALGYSMRERNAFPQGTDLIDVLEFYFQCCSLELTAEMMSVVAATLANGGICPVTGERVFRPETVQKCLSLMSSCGMYDFSGEWAFRIGLPAKSGVSGAILIVVPNVMGLCAWSPRLDEHGNSVRGIKLCEHLVDTFNFHAFDNLVGGQHGKKDPRRQPEEDRRNRLVDLCWAASEGDLSGIRRLVVQGVELDDADYDGRTALHLAASEGRSEVVEFLIRQGVRVAPVDRWGNTPLDDAKKAGHDDVARLLVQPAAA